MSKANQQNRLKRGDYVLATKYSDGDPRDHFCVGFFREMLVDKWGNITILGRRRQWGAVSRQWIQALRTDTETYWRYSCGRIPVHRGQARKKYMVLAATFA